RRRSCPRPRGRRRPARRGRRGRGGWRSRPHQPGDGPARLVDLLGGVVPGGDRLVHAVVEVVVEQGEGDALEGAGRGGDLGEDVDAVRVLLHHAVDPAHLALDAAQPLEQGVLRLDVTGHAYTL